MTCQYCREEALYIIDTTTRPVKLCDTHLDTFSQGTGYTDYFPGPNSRGCEFCYQSSDTFITLYSEDEPETAAFRFPVCWQCGAAFLDGRTTAKQQAYRSITFIKEYNS